MRHGRIPIAGTLGKGAKVTLATPIACLLPVFCTSDGL